jgi:putative two-component system response regulator
MKQTRILIVDDLAENREILTGLLEVEGHDLETAKDGLEAVERATANPPDLILMDVTMPRLTGFEACRRLKADPRTELVPIVLVTGLLAREDRIQGIAAGCDDFLTKPVDSEQLIARTRNLLRTKALVDELEQAENVLVSLATALDAKDPYTSGHSQRVGTYAEDLGAAMGLAGKERRNLRRAGLLHDIGKIGIDDNVLRKPGALTPEEFEHIKTHPELGCRILDGVKQLDKVMPVVRHHHEAWNGGGYPAGLKAEDTPFLARVVAVADSIDAMSSDRPYRKGMTDEKLDAILRDGAGKQWDPKIVDAAFQVRDELRRIGKEERHPLELDVDHWHADMSLVDTGVEERALV